MSFLIFDILTLSTLSCFLCYNLYFYKNNYLINIWNNKGTCLEVGVCTEAEYGYIHSLMGTRLR